MRAIQAKSYGGPEVLELVDLPVPVPGPDEVLVRVVAAGTNPVDWKARAGYVSDWFGGGPYIWGWDVSGVVESVGAGVTGFQPGDAVFGMPRFPALAGGYAEYVAAPAAHLIQKPDHLDHVRAAALPLAGLTALQILDLAGVRAGQRVLVTAAAGGVGHLAVQLAKERGAHVLGTARAANHDFLRGLGVDEPIDYTAVDVAGAVPDVDVVLDSVGAHDLLRTVRPGGTMVTFSSGLPDTLKTAADAAGVQALGHLVRPDAAGLARLLDLYEAGRLRVEIARVLPLAEVATAHELLATTRTRGKIVLSL
ncbi:NADP-dependent oxidoreductase [Planosporangium mesophilum]|uniref:NADPH:quinone reductase n=1 Tax=Planosporangium mesophilum TaxID=689768 RepID=A0A8J3TCN1_9ACTN|nr:NADP-dependent oxidoreductase [Planosporangium mesophilum]NJC85490.1 NADP-dependent oxidoreductase [Planosporangium mesophilum]GII23998.1 NADPH:quinone reductase [Planosporangium mesophilum]